MGTYFVEVWFVACRRFSAVVSSCRAVAGVEYTRCSEAPALVSACMAPCAPQEFRDFCDEFWILELGWRRAGVVNAKEHCQQLLRDFIGEPSSMRALGSCTSIGSPRTAEPAALNGCVLSGDGLEHVMCARLCHMFEPLANGPLVGVVG